MLSWCLFLCLIDWARAIRHAHEMTERTKCGPAAELVDVTAMQHEAHRDYLPSCTVVYRCAKQLACCDRLSQCTVKTSNIIVKTFIVSLFASLLILLLLKPTSQLPIPLQKKLTRWKLKVTKEGYHHNCDKTCNKSCNTCTSLAALISIVLCVYNIMRELATCSQSQRTVQSMLSAHWVVSAACWLNAPLVTRIEDVAPRISLQLLLQLWYRSVATCLLHVEIIIIIIIKCLMCPK